jgi:hypothetical protein
VDRRFGVGLDVLERVIISRNSDGRNSRVSRVRVLSRDYRRQAGLVVRGLAAIGLDRWNRSIWGMQESRGGSR